MCWPYLVVDWQAKMPFEDSCIGYGMGLIAAATPKLGNLVGY